MVTTGHTLYVAGIDFHVTEDDLQKVFGKYGVLTNVSVIRDHFTGQSRGFAYVCFEDSQRAAEAKDGVTGKEFNGKPVKIEFSRTEFDPNHVGSGEGPPRGRGRGMRGPARGQGLLNLVGRGLLGPPPFRGGALARAMKTRGRGFGRGLMGRGEIPHDVEVDFEEGDGILPLPGLLRGGPSGRRAGFRGHQRGGFRGGNKRPLEDGGEPENYESGMQSFEDEMLSPEEEHAQFAEGDGEGPGGKFPRREGPPRGRGGAYRRGSPHMRGRGELHFRGGPLSPRGRESPLHYGGPPHGRESPPNYDGLPHGRENLANYGGHPRGRGRGEMGRGRHLGPDEGRFVDGPSRGRGSPGFGRGGPRGRGGRFDGDHRPRGRDQWDEHSIEFEDRPARSEHAFDREHPAGRGGPRFHQEEVMRRGGIRSGPGRGGRDGPNFGQRDTPPHARPSSFGNQVPEANSGPYGSIRSPHVQGEDAFGSGRPGPRPGIIQEQGRSPSDTKGPTKAGLPSSAKDVSPAIAPGKTGPGPAVPSGKETPALVGSLVKVTPGSASLSGKITPVSGAQPGKETSGSVAPNSKSGGGQEIPTQKGKETEAKAALNNTHTKNPGEKPKTILAAVPGPASAKEEANPSTPSKEKSATAKTDSPSMVGGKPVNVAAVRGAPTSARSEGESTSSGKSTSRGRERSPRHDSKSSSSDRYSRSRGPDAPSRSDSSSRSRDRDSRSDRSRPRERSKDRFGRDRSLERKTSSRYSSGRGSDSRDSSHRSSDRRHENSSLRREGDSRPSRTSDRDREHDRDRGSGKSRSQERDASRRDRVDRKPGETPSERNASQAKDRIEKPSADAPREREGQHPPPRVSDAPLDSVASKNAPTRNPAPPDPGRMQTSRHPEQGHPAEWDGSWSQGETHFTRNAEEQGRPGTQRGPEPESWRWERPPTDPYYSKEYQSYPDGRRPPSDTSITRGAPQGHGYLERELSSGRDARDPGNQRDFYAGERASQAWSQEPYHGPPRGDHYESAPRTGQRPSYYPTESRESHEPPHRQEPTRGEPGRADPYGPPRVPAADRVREVGSVPRSYPDQGVGYYDAPRREAEKYPASSSHIEGDYYSRPGRSSELAQPSSDPYNQQREREGFAQHDNYGQPRDPYSAPKDAYGPPREERDHQREPYSHSGANFNTPKEPYALQKEGYGPPKESYGPPQDYRGPPKDPYGPPRDSFVPPKDPYATSKDPYGPSKEAYGPSKEAYGPPKDTYTPSKDNYGASMYGPPRDSHTSAKDNYGTSSGQYTATRDPYSQSTDRYAPAKDSYRPPNDPYTHPKDSYGVARDSYGPQKGSYATSRETYGPPKDAYGTPKDSYGPSKDTYTAPSSYASQREYSEYARSYPPDVSSSRDYYQYENGRQTAAGAPYAQSRGYADYTAQGTEARPAHAYDEKYPPGDRVPSNNRESLSYQPREKDLYDSYPGASQYDPSRRGPSVAMTGVAREQAYSAERYPSEREPTRGPAPEKNQQTTRMDEYAAYSAQGRLDYAAYREDTRQQQLVRDAMAEKPAGSNRSMYPYERQEAIPGGPSGQSRAYYQLSSGSTGRELQSGHGDLPAHTHASHIAQQYRSATTGLTSGGPPQGMAQSMSREYPSGITGQAMAAKSQASLSKEVPKDSSWLNYDYAAALRGISGIDKPSTASQAATNLGGSLYSKPNEKRVLNTAGGAVTDSRSYLLDKGDHGGGYVGYDRPSSAKATPQPNPVADKAYTNRLQPGASVADAQGKGLLKTPTTLPEVASSAAAKPRYLFPSAAAVAAASSAGFGLLSGVKTTVAKDNRRV